MFILLCILSKLQLYNPLLQHCISFNKYHAPPFLLLLYVLCFSTVYFTLHLEFHFKWNTRLLDGKIWQTKCIFRIVGKTHGFINVGNGNTHVGVLETFIPTQYISTKGHCGLNSSEMHRQYYWIAAVDNSNPSWVKGNIWQFVLQHEVQKW